MRFRRLFPLFGVLLIGAQLLTSVILLPQSASALTGDEMRVIVRKYSIYGAFRSCLAQNVAYNDVAGGNETQQTMPWWDVMPAAGSAGLMATRDGVVNPQWATLGYVVESDGGNNDGKATCRDTPLMVVNNLGITAGDLMKGLGYQLNSSGNWTTTLPTTNSASLEYTAVEGSAIASRWDTLAKNKGIPTSEPDGYGYWYLADAAFKRACSPSIVANPGTAEIAKADVINGYMWEATPTLTGNAVNTAKTLYKFNNNTGVAAYPRPAHDNDGTADCNDIAKVLAAGGVATTKYAAYLNNLIEEAKKKAINDSGVITEYCKSRYPNRSKPIDQDSYKNCITTTTTAQEKCWQKITERETLPNGKPTGDTTQRDRTTDEKAACMKDNNVDGTLKDILDLVKKIDDIIKTATPGDITAPGFDTTPGDDTTTTCAVEGIGWIICPVMNFMAGANDMLYAKLSEFLAVNPKIFTGDTNSDSTSDLYAAWNAFRGYANILFIVAFLIIIYSQITSVGITNYGVKKLLPKLIIAAVLVNISFYICQVLVDVSNILGFGLKSLFTAIGGGISTSGSGDTGGGWETAIGGALAITAAGVAVVLAVAVGGTLLVGALLSLLMVVIILIARQAIIILLIAVSPIAFVAWLLPNTEKWFKKWWEMFFSMLMLFPIISVLFGAGALAARILGTGDFGDETTTKLAALGASVLPLIATIPLLQSALKTTGALGAKLSGMSQKANSRLASSVKAKGKERYDNSSFAKGRALRKQGREEYRNRKFAEAVSGEGTGPLGRLRRLSATGGAIGNNVAAITPRMRFAQSRVGSAAAAKMDALEAEAAKEATERQKSMTTAEVAAIAATGLGKDKLPVSAAERAAAIDRTMATGSFQQRQDVLANLAANKSTTSRSLRQRAVAGAYAKGDQGIYGNGFGDNIIAEHDPANKQGTINSAEDLAKAAVENAADGKVQAEHLAQNGAATAWLVNEVINNGSAHPRAATARTKLQPVAKEAQTSQATRTRIDDTGRKAMGLL